MQLTGVAKYRDGTTAEDDIPLTVTVLDQNDNAPYFELHTGNITEASKEGTTRLTYFLYQPCTVSDESCMNTLLLTTSTLISHFPLFSLV